MKKQKMFILFFILTILSFTFPHLISQAETIGAIKITTAPALIYDDSLQEEVITLAKDSIVTVLSESNGWAKINYRLYTGYVQSNTLQAATAQYMVTSAKFEPNVRLLNDSQGEVVGNLPSSRIVEVYAIDKTGWAFVRTDDLSGFVDKIALTIPPKKQMIVQEAKGLSVKNSASPSSETIGHIPKSTKVMMLSTSNGWAFVEDKTVAGYVPVTGLKEAPKNSGATNPKEGIKPNMQSTKKRIALTFDDGPHPKVTRQIVKILEKYDAKATFFVVGKNAQKYPEILKEIKNEGHEIGNHTYDHEKLTTLSVKQVRTQIHLTDIAVKSAIDQNTTAFRPPYGAYNKTITGLLQVPNVMWTIDTLDWKHRDPNKTLKAVKTNAKRDSIVLMHDIHQTTADSLDSIMAFLTEQGYEFVTISELLEK